VGVAVTDEQQPVETSNKRAQNPEAVDMTCPMLGADVNADGVDSSDDVVARFGPRKFLGGVGPVDDPSPGSFRSEDFGVRSSISIPGPSTA